MQLEQPWNNHHRLNESRFDNFETRLVYLNQVKQDNQTEGGMPLYGLENRPEQIENGLQKEQCEAMLSRLKAPIQNHSDFERVKKDWSVGNSILSSFESGSIDLRNLTDYLENDIALFLSETEKAQLDISRIIGHNTDNLAETFKPAEKDLVSLLRGPDSKERDEAKKTVAKRLLERDQSLKLLDRVPRELTDKIYSLIVEAQEIQQEKMRTYLESDCKALKEEVESLSNEQISSKQKSDILHFVNGVAKKALHHPDLFADNGKAVEQLQKNLSQARHIMASVRQETESIDEEKLLIKKVEQVEAVFAGMSHAQAGELKRALTKNAAEINGKNISGGRLQFLDQLPDGVRDELKKVRSTLAKGGIGPEERLQIQRELDTLLKVVGGINFAQKALDSITPVDQLKDVQKVSRLMEMIAGMSDMDEIKKTLEAHLSLGNLDNPKATLVYVNHAEFEAQFRPYTTKGSMVFLERQDEKKVIIDQSIFSDPTKAKNLVSQVSHELRHWVFEGNPELKAKWVETFTKNADWSTIKNIFVETYPTKQPPRDCEAKTSYVANDWRDEDVLSELYAMEVGMDPNKPLTPLSKAVVDAGIPAEIMGIKQPAIIRGQEDDGNVEAIMEQVQTQTIEGGAASNEMMKSAEELEEAINKVDEKITKLIKSRYTNHVPGANSLLRVMRDYNNDNRKLLKMHQKDPSSILSNAIEKRLETLSKDIDEVSIEEKKIQEQYPNDNMTVWRNIWNGTTFISVGDIWQVALDVKEFLERRHKRKEADHAARVGSALTEGIPLLDDFGTEAAARQEKAEADEVNEWKSRLENKDAWDLYGIIEKMAGAIDPNKDQFKAIMRILSEKGRINWHNKHIWAIFNKLQNVAYFSETDERLTEDSTYLDARLHAATGAIWDNDEYQELKRKNESSYNSKKQEYFPDIDRTPGAIGERLKKLIEKHQHGAKVEPAEYEALLEYSMKNGKFYAEGVMYYLIIGMARGLLTADRGLALDAAYLNGWPAIEWFTASTAPKTQEGFEKLATKVFPEDYNSYNVGPKFLNFYWTVIQETSQVKERVSKSVSERGWDHDWGRSIAALGDGTVAKRFLQGRSGQEEAKLTAIPNAYAGALQWLQENAKTLQANPSGYKDLKNKFARQIGWVAMSNAILDDVAFHSAKGAPFTRGNSSIWSATAREGSVAGVGDWNAGDMRNYMQEFLNTIDHQFFQVYLRDSRRAKKDAPGLLNDIQAHLNSRYGPGVWNDCVNLDDIFNNLDGVIYQIIERTDTNQFMNMITKTLT